MGGFYRITGYKSKAEREYARAFYLDRDGACYPLDDLRRGGR